MFQQRELLKSKSNCEFGLSLGQVLIVPNKGDYNIITMFFIYVVYIYLCLP